MEAVQSQSLRLGAYTVAIVTRQRAGGRKFAKGAAFHGGKWPCFVVIHDGKAETAFDMTGQRVAAEEVRRLCPSIGDMP